ncbi:CTAG/Pcc1 family [Elaphomyces granulatus]|jgi:EKC/KEOPS complex subunit PCC1/LAGE3
MSLDSEFPYSLMISLPLPTHRLASSALRALQVDAELSPYVRRSFALKAPEYTRNDHSEMDSDEDSRTILETTYQAATNRMLRVAVNGFMESLGVVLGVMEELDIDVLGNELRS